MAIWGEKFLHDESGHACTKIVLKGYEISIAMDDSCGCLNKYGRVDVKVFKNDEDVTKQFFPESEYIQPINGEILLDLMNQIVELTILKGV